MRAMRKRALRKRALKKRPTMFSDLNFGIAIGLQAFVILFVGYCFDHSTEVGTCCCIMGGMTVLGLAMKKTKSAEEET